MKNTFKSKGAFEKVFNLEWQSNNEDTADAPNSGKPWKTEDTVLLVKMAFAGVSTHDMARVLGRTAYSVQLTLSDIANCIVRKD